MQPERLARIVTTSWSNLLVKRNLKKVLNKIWLFIRCQLHFFSHQDYVSSSSKIEIFVARGEYWNKWSWKYCTLNQIPSLLYVIKVLW